MGRQVSIPRRTPGEQAAYVEGLRAGVRLVSSALKSQGRLSSRARRALQVAERTVRTVEEADGDA